MRLSRQHLRKIIKEELQKLNEAEGWFLLNSDGSLVNSQKTRTPVWWPDEKRARSAYDSGYGEEGAAAVALRLVSDPYAYNGSNADPRDLKYAQQARGMVVELTTPGNIHEAGIGRKLFGWMKDKDWEQEVERIETAENIKTIGDLKFVLDLAKLAKTDEKAEKAWTGFATGFIADALGGGTVKSLADVVTDTYKAPDEATSGTALAYLNVDDGIAKIVDDPIENAYIEDLEDMIAGEDPETPLEDFDVTKGLANFIKKNIDDRTVTGWDGQQEGRKMKITKRQLKRIIKEEKAKILREQIDPQELADAIKWGLKDLPEMEDVVDMYMIPNPNSEVGKELEFIYTAAAMALPAGLPSSDEVYERREALPYPDMQRIPDGIMNWIDLA